MKRNHALRRLIAAASLLLLTGCNGMFGLPLAPKPEPEPAKEEPTVKEPAPANVTKETEAKPVEEKKEE